MTVTNAVEKIRKFYNDELSTRIPFDTHPLKDASEYTKNLYCTMLAALLQYENEPLREQLIFLERIIKGVGLETSIEHFIQKSKLIDEQFAKDFYEEFVEHPLAKNFVVDALVMTNAREKINDKQMEFLVEVVDVLGIGKEDFQELIKLALSILKQSKVDFIDVILERWNIKYFQQFKYVDINVNHFYHPNYLYKGSVEEINEFMNSESEILIFEKCFFDSEMDNDLSNKKLVIFKDCTFKNIKERLNVSNIDHLIFVNCMFNNSSEGLYLKNVGNLLFQDCTFRNLKGSEDREFIVVYNNAINLYLIDNVFENIFISCSILSELEGVIFYGNIQNYDISGNQFFNCRGNRYKTTSLLYFIYSSKVVNDSLINGVTFKQFVKEHLGLKLGEKRINNNEIKDCNPDRLIN